MEEITDEYIKAAILYRLHKQGKWDGSHTDFENLKKGFSPRHLGKKGLKRLEKLAEELIKDGYIIPKVTSYGYHVSLNPRRSGEIQQIVEKFISEF